MSFFEYAHNELARARLINPEDMTKSSPIALQVLDLLSHLEQQGHNRHHGPNSTVELFHRLAYGLPLMPLTGEDDEWFWVLPGAMQQNKRCARVIRFADGKAWDNEAIVFENPLTGARMITERSAMEITSWPYMPTTRIVQASSPQANATMELPVSVNQPPVTDPDFAERFAEASAAYEAAEAQTMLDAQRKPFEAANSVPDKATSVDDESFFEGPF